MDGVVEHHQEWAVDTFTESSLQQFGRGDLGVTGRDGAAFAVGGGALIDLLTTSAEVREVARIYLPWMILMPVVGVPLPLVSYGGSAMLVIMAGFGLMMSIYVHRQEELPRGGGIL